MEGKYKDVNLVSGSAGERLRVRHSEGSVCASGGKAAPNVRPQLAYSEDNSVDQLWKRAKKKGWEKRLKTHGNYARPNTALAFNGSSGVDWRLQSSVTNGSPFDVGKRK